MMKKILASKVTAIVLLAVTVISMVFYVYMLARPVSYGMSYHNETAYEGGTFEGEMKFHLDGTMVNSNTNFAEEMKSRYYYKSGYVFFTMAITDEAYEKEVEEINNNFEEAIKKPFYADKINAFKLVCTEEDGVETVYTCVPAIVFAVVGGIVEIVLIGLVCAAFLLRKKFSASL